MQSQQHLPPLLRVFPVPPSQHQSIRQLRQQPVQLRQRPVPLRPICHLVFSGCMRLGLDDVEVLTIREREQPIGGLLPGSLGWHKHTDGNAAVVRDDELAVGGFVSNVFATLEIAWTRAMKRLMTITN